MSTKLLIGLQLPPPTPPPSSASSPTTSISKPPISFPSVNEFHSLSSISTTTTTSTAPIPTITRTDSGILFREKLMYLQDLNVDPHKALNLNPSLRSSSICSIRSVEHLLSTFGLSRSSIGRILDMHPILLNAEPNSYILPVLRFLISEIPISASDLPKCINRCPRLLVSSVPFQLRPALSFLRSLGFVGHNAINCHTTVLLVSSIERTLLPKIKYLQESLGLSLDEVSTMVIRSPGLLTYSVHKNLVPKLEYFVNEMGRDVDELKRFPQYFSFSLERKIKPRHEWLAEHGLSMPLPMMLKVSDGEFNVRLIEMRLGSVEGGRDL